MRGVEGIKAVHAFPHSDAKVEEVVYDAANQSFFARAPFHRDQVFGRERHQANANQNALLQQVRHLRGWHSQAFGKLGDGGMKFEEAMRVDDAFVFFGHAASHDLIRP